MRGLGGLVVALGLAGCFSPSAPNNAPCSSGDHCPSGQTCTATPAGMVCLGASPLDAAAGTDGAPDGTAGDGGVACFGTGLVSNVCFDVLPTAALVVSGTLAVDTTDATACDRLVQVSGQAVCVIAARTITIETSGRLVATGGRALVLLAVDTLTISGTLDAASRGNGQIGAGARTTCGSSVEGEAGDVQGGGGGGGAGGSLVLVGGRGGNGSVGASGGEATSPADAMALRGGCPGGLGGTGGAGGGAGIGGQGGGAIYLIAGSTLTISGTINASGGGGGHGAAGAASSGGGGGGGAGGVIGLDAPAIAVTGSVFANGGGGGAGNGDMADAMGTSGGEPTTFALPASGGSGVQGGGHGGVGFARGQPAAMGVNGAGEYSAGGGGGGAGGRVRVFQVSPTSIDGAISPPPT